MNSRKTVVAIILVIAFAALLPSWSRPEGSVPSVPATPIPTPTLPSVSRTTQPAPAVTPASAMDPAALLSRLPADASLIEAISVHVTGYADQLIVAMLGYGRTLDSLAYDRIEMVVFDVSKPPSDSTVWTSGPTIGDRAETLQVRDINQDGVSEVLSLQSSGASGQMLYVLGFVSGVPAYLKPSGGRFEGQDYFGEAGVRLEDIDRDGLLDILASYGPAAASTDVYRWDGFKYALAVTLQDK